MNADRQNDAKQRAALQAVDLVVSGMVLGLGSGSTAVLVVDELGRRLRDGRLSDIVGVPTSRATHERAVRAGVPVTDLDSRPVLDLSIDGADEVDPEGNLIKGLGAALLREKIVATASRHLAIVVDASKLVERLGTRAPLPVEVVPFGHRSHDALFAELGGRPLLRVTTSGAPLVTDEGHWIIDVRFDGGIAAPDEVARRLKLHPGIVETGLFLGMRPTVIVGRPEA